MTIKFEFPADRTDIALAIGQALVSIGGGATVSAVATGTAIHGAIEQHLDAAGADVPFDPTSQSEFPDEGPANDLPLDQAAVNDLQSGASSEVDQKGVPFNMQMCAKAEKPFYASGKYAGQWKKKGGAQGPTQEAYDAWYAGELLKVTAAPTTTTTTAEPQVDLSNVWSAPKPEQPKAPTNPGELFAWIAEMQTANRLTQPDIDAAYVTNQLSAQQMFGCTDVAVQGQMVTALYNTLATKVSA